MTSSHNASRRPRDRTINWGAFMTPEYKECPSNYTTVPLLIKNPCGTKPAHWKYCVPPDEMSEDARMVAEQKKCFECLPKGVTLIKKQNPYHRKDESCENGATRFPQGGKGCFHQYNGSGFHSTLRRNHINIYEIPDK